MALTGNTVQSTYLDLVQLEKSGAGLPSHAGKQAALYDGGGNQILGRTAQPSWLDPHPDAASFAETFEFSTMGDKTQGELEALGWTFNDCTGKVENGFMELTATSIQVTARAYLTVNLTGDFVFTSSCVPGHHIFNSKNADGGLAIFGTFGVGDTVNNVAHYCSLRGSNDKKRNWNFTSGTWTGGGGSDVQQALNANQVEWLLRRSSGTVFLTGGAGGEVVVGNWTNPANLGWSGHTSASDANTFDRLFLGFSNTGPTIGDKAYFRFLRRFA